jgi:hypothetical protein
MQSSPNRDRASSLPRYLEKLVAARALLRPGELVNVIVRHNSDCRIWRRRPCNCDPDVELVRLLPHGSVA